MDVTAVVTYIDGLAAPIALIAGSALIVFAGIKGWKWVRRAM